MIETLMLAVQIEEDQLAEAKRDGWDSPTMEAALNGLNETAQNIRTARSHGRVSKKMERVLFKRLGKVAQGYIKILRENKAAEDAKARVTVGPIKVTQFEDEEGRTVTEIEPDIDMIHEQAIFEHKTREEQLDSPAKQFVDEVDLSFNRPLKDQVKLRTDGFAAPERLTAAMNMERQYKPDVSDEE